MPTSHAATDPAEVLLTHDQWANEQLLDACASLTAEQLHQRFDMGLGSLHDTLAHIAGAHRGWTDVLTGGDPRSRIEQGGPYTLDQLRALLTETAAGFRTAALALPFDQQVTAERQGRTYTFTRGGILTHVATHGMHHRAQCLNMLRRLGVDPLPQSSVMQWMLQGNA